MLGGRKCLAKGRNISDLTQSQCEVQSRYNQLKKSFTFPLLYLISFIINKNNNKNTLHNLEVISIICITRAKHHTLIYVKIYKSFVPHRIIFGSICVNNHIKQISWTGLQDSGKHLC